MSIKKFESYYKAVQFLEGLYNLPLENEFLTLKSADDPTIFIKRMDDLLRRLKNPEKNLKIIHVTGTAGKGSVSTGIHKGLVKAGQKAGLFTSPFITTSIEKIQVDNKYISPEEFAGLVEEIKPVIDDMHKSGPYGRPSYFEIFLGLAMLYFKKQNCEWVVLEVGCGGRYDATNFVKKPEVAVITNIDYDHTHLLGKTLPKIARDKGGIIKSDCSFFTTETRPELLKIFKGYCDELKADFNQMEADGDYQYSNLGLINAVLSSLDFKELKEKDLPQLPARFELISQDPRVVIDGAHSPIKMRATVKNLQRLRYSKLHLVVATAGNKNSSDILTEIIPKADHIYFTRFQIKERKAADPLALSKQAKVFQKTKVSTGVFIDPHQAFEAALAKAKTGDLILVTGSFFLAGDLRQRFISEEQILKSRKCS